MERAAQAADQFDFVLLFSTKWEPPHPIFAGPMFGKGLQERFFDYHEDATPQQAAAMLGARIVSSQNRNNEWVAILEIEKIENADAAPAGVDPATPFATAHVEKSPQASDHQLRRSGVYTEETLGSFGN